MDDSLQDHVGQSRDGERDEQELCSNQNRQKQKGVIFNEYNSVYTISKVQSNLSTEPIVKHPSDNFTNFFGYIVEAKRKHTNMLDAKLLEDMNLDAEEEIGCVMSKFEIKIVESCKDNISDKNDNISCTSNAQNPPAVSFPESLKSLVTVLPEKYISPPIPVGGDCLDFNSKLIQNEYPNNAKNSFHSISSKKCSSLPLPSTKNSFRRSNNYKGHDENRREKLLTNQTSIDCLISRNCKFPYTENITDPVKLNSKISMNKQQNVQRNIQINQPDNVNNLEQEIFSNVSLPMFSNSLVKKGKSKTDQFNVGSVSSKNSCKVPEKVITKQRSNESWFAVQEGRYPFFAEEGKENKIWPAPSRQNSNINNNEKSCEDIGQNTCKAIKDYIIGLKDKNGFSNIENASAIPVYISVAGSLSRRGKKKDIPTLCAKSTDFVGEHTIKNKNMNCTMHFYFDKNLQSIPEIQPKEGSHFKSKSTRNVHSHMHNRKNEER